MDRRSSNRKSSRVELQARAQGRAFPVQFYNISLSGCSVDCSSLDVFEGDEIIFNFSDHIRVPGKIAWRHRGTAGVQFDAPLHKAIAAHLGFKAGDTASPNDLRSGTGEMGPESPPKPTPEAVAPAALRVMVVDDDEGLRRLMRRTLERMGFVQIYSAKDGSEGLELARLQIPDVILSDYEMPNKHGLQLLRGVRDEPALDATAFVMVSGHANDAVTDKAMEWGANSTITKPFFPDDLKRQLEAVVLQVTGLKIEWPPRNTNSRGAKA